MRFFLSILDIEGIKLSCFVETRSFYSKLFKKFSLAVAALNSVNPLAMEKGPNALVTSPQRGNSSPVYQDWFPLPAVTRAKTSLTTALKFRPQRLR